MDSEWGLTQGLLKSLVKVLTSSVDAMMRSVVDGREGGMQNVSMREKNRVGPRRRRRDRTCSCPAPTRARNGRGRDAICRLARRRYEAKMEEEEEEHKV